jgi:hypothetical protein
MNATETPHLRNKIKEMGEGCLLLKKWITLGWVLFHGLPRIPSSISAEPCYMTPGSDSSDNQTTRPRRPARIGTVVGRVLLMLALACMFVWGVLALSYSDLRPGLRPIAATLLPIAGLALLVFVKPRRRGLLLFLAAFALLVVWWLRIPASNDRDWQPDVALLPHAQINGPQVTIHNIRNCVYRSETDYDVRYYDKTFDLNKLNTADLYVVYWGSPMIAHTMLSFGFDGRDYVCISIETRKEKGEGYSTVKGFFRQYELVYVVADERDLVRLRTNYRGEDVYLYRLRVDPEVIRNVFLDYLREINSLTQRPEWYNALTTNCTTSIRGHAKPYARRRWPSWKIIINGYVDELAYDNGAIDHGLPFAEMKARSRINERAIKADKDPAFSKRIRQGLPGFDSATN